MRVVITGAGGLIGRSVAASLRTDGAEVVAAGRDRMCDVRWDAECDEFPAASLEGVDAVLHFAGAPIGKRWTNARRQSIARSRLDGTAALVRAFARVARPPRMLLSASAVGFYGDCGDALLTEESKQGTGFLADLAAAWESRAYAAASDGTRVAVLRFGVVLSRHGGALAEMLPVFRLGLGGPLGSGSQWMSWVSLADAVRAVRHILAARLGGAFNVVAPNPVTNATFSATLAAAVGRPAFLRVPSWSLRLAFGEMADEALLASQRVVPARLRDSGFTFTRKALADAIAVECSPSRPR